MHLTVDPIIYQVRTGGGVKRIYDEIIPRMCDQERDLYITLLKEQAYNKYKSSPPQHERITQQLREEAKVPRIPFKRPYRLWRSLERSYQFLITRPYHYRTRHHIWHSTYFTLPPHGWGGKQVVTVYDLVYFLYLGHFNRPIDDEIRGQQAWAIRQADAIICISDTTAHDLQRIFSIDESRIRVIYLASKPIFRVMSLNAAHEIMPQLNAFILYVGGRGQHKNFDGLLRAYSQWDKRHDIKLIAVGQPLSPDEQKRIAEYHLNDCVNVLPEVDDERLCALYNQAAALVYPSRYEGFGIPLLEAMCCACPIVASRIPTSIEIGATFPFYFEVDNDEALREALDNAINTPKNAPHILQAIDYAQRFSWDQTAQATLDLYHQLD